MSYYEEDCAVKYDFADQPLFYHDTANQKIHYKVNHCPGINSKTQELMADQDIIYCYELVGQFLCFQKNEEKFNEWLRDSFESMNEPLIQECTEAIADYVKRNI
jgi:hypothetical protein